MPPAPETAAGDRGLWGRDKRAGLLASGPHVQLTPASRPLGGPADGRVAGTLELTILMPCLNEAETLVGCIRKAKQFITDNQVVGEVLVADNGSTDGSQAIAEREGARVVNVKRRGYGAALVGGIEAATSRFVIMGDADDSYDFSMLMPFVDRLRAGADMVVGNRFQGGIAKGARPPLHRYIGNPVLSFIGRLFFRISISDFHCGLRGFDRERVVALRLRTTGMEFASEMIVASALADYRIEEVPTTLRKDGRSRPPHLRTWRDGWRHLSFLLMYSPKWLFLYSGVLFVLFGAIIAFALMPGSIAVGNVHFDIHTFIVACGTVLVGTQAIAFAVVARRFATVHELIPPSQRYSRLLDALTWQRVLIAGVVIGAVGIVGLLWCVGTWLSTGFGPITYIYLLRILVLSMTAILIGLQFVFFAFLSAIIEIKTR